MEQAISALLMLDEQCSKKGGADIVPRIVGEILQSAADQLAKANRGMLEAIYNSIAQYPPSGHFFLWVSLLEAESNLREIDLSAFFRRCQTFISVVEKDLVKLAIPKFITLVRNFTERLVAANRPAPAIRTLKAALHRISPGPDYLTPIHALIAQVCLLAKNYKAALPILERDVTEIDQTRTGVQPLDALLYFYYGGMIYVGLKQYRKAQDFFALAISAPAQSISAVVIESHKKFVLVSLLIEGQVGTLPKYTSSFVARQLKIANQAYLDFAKAYVTFKQDTLKESYAKLLLEFTKDKNAGLAAQVVESLYRRNILRLTQTYVTLSLADIASSVQLPDPKVAEAYLLRMIEEGYIHAKIDQKEGMVSFQSNPEQYNTSNTMAKLDAHLKAAAVLGTRVEELQRKIALSPAYLQKLVQGEKGPAAYEDSEFDGPAEKHHGGVQLQ